MRAHSQTNHAAARPAATALGKPASWMRGAEALGVLLLFCGMFLRAWAGDAAIEERLAAVKSADDSRMAAMKTADPKALDAVLSDDLRYAHSTGTVDTKSSMIKMLTSGITKYLSFDYEQRTVTFPGPTIALMSGRVRIRTLATKTAVDKTDTLSFLAVWRFENGHWRFLAWQSCKLSTPIKQ